jgi:hypothetical protein
MGIKLKKAEIKEPIWANENMGNKTALLRGKLVSSHRRKWKSERPFSHKIEYI